MQNGTREEGPITVLARHVVLETRSVLEARGDTSMFQDIQDYRALGDPAAFHLRLASVVIDDVRISAIQSTGHAIGLLEEDHVTLLTPYRGTIATETATQRLEAREAGVIVPRRGARRTLVGEAYLGLAVQLPLDRLRREARANPHDAPVPARAFDGGLDPRGPASAALQRHLRFLVAEVDAGDSLLLASRAARSAADMLTALLFDCFAAVPGPASPRPAAAGRRHVERAEAVIRARINEELSVPALAAELGVGTRALQLAFQAHRGVTPRDVIASTRLDTVHARLRAGAPGESVTRIALDCGITHLGRFAARFRDRFGEPPSETLARAQRKG